jgi:hypothetical protein
MWHWSAAVFCRFIAIVGTLEAVRQRTAALHSFDLSHPNDGWFQAQAEWEINRKSLLSSPPKSAT